MNSITQQVSLLKRPQAKQSAGLKALLALLCVLFLAAQIQGLNHTHEGNLDYQADCDICLKLSSGDDVLIASCSETPTRLSQQAEAQYASADLPAELVKFRQARAPPIA